MLFLRTHTIGVSQNLISISRIYPAAPKFDLDISVAKDESLRTTESQNVIVRRLAPNSS